MWANLRLQCNDTYVETNAAIPSYHRTLFLCPSERRVLEGPQIPRIWSCTSASCQFQVRTGAVHGAVVSQASVSTPSVTCSVTEVNPVLVTPGGGGRRLPHEHAVLVGKAGTSRGVSCCLWQAHMRYSWFLPTQIAMTRPCHDGNDEGMVYNAFVGCNVRKIMRLYSHSHNLDHRRCMVTIAARMPT